MNKTIVCLIAGLIFFISFTGRSSGQIALIINKNNPTEDIAWQDLKQMFLGKKTTFPNGKNIVLAEHADLKEKFYKSLLDWSLLKVKKQWMRLIFSGQNSSAPEEFSNSTALKEFILNNEGAIAFIDPVEVDDTVKIIAIDGKKFDDEKYPLK